MSFLSVSVCALCLCGENIPAKPTTETEPFTKSQSGASAPNSGLTARAELVYNGDWLGRLTQPGFTEDPSLAKAELSPKFFSTCRRGLLDHG